MQYLIETLIYLLAILGIIFTCISFYEMFDINKYITNTYRIYSRKNKGEKRVKVIVKIKGFDEIEEDELKNKINNDNKLKEISNDIIIEKLD